MSTCALDGSVVIWDFKVNYLFIAKLSIIRNFIIIYSH